MQTPKNWRELERHPLSAEYVNIDGPEWDVFVGSLRANGILNDRRVTLHEGRVLVGWQLLRGCIEADITPKFQQLPEGVAPELFVEVMNDRRRHEDADTIRRRAQARRERVLAARAEGCSTRAIAETEGVSQTQVQRDLEAAGEPGGSPERQGDETTEKDGKKYARSKKKRNRSKPRQRDNIDSVGALLDAVDQPVPPGLITVFNKVKAFDDLLNRLTAINQDLATLKQSPAGVCLRLQQAKADLKNLKETIRFDMPFAICPVCMGNAKSRKANCPCKQRGWLIEGAYKNLPAEYRK